MSKPIQLQTSFQLKLELAPLAQARPYSSSAPGLLALAGLRVLAIGSSCPEPAALASRDPSKPARLAIGVRSGHELVGRQTTDSEVSQLFNMGPLSSIHTCRSVRAATPAGAGPVAGPAGGRSGCRSSRIHHTAVDAAEPKSDVR